MKRWLEFTVCITKIERTKIKKIPQAWLEVKPKGCKFVYNALFLATFDNLENTCQAVKTLL